MIIKREIGEKGQVVIPKDIREMFNLRKGEKVVFEIKAEGALIRPEQNPEEYVEDFLNVPKKLKRRLTGKEIKKIILEQY